MSNFNFSEPQRQSQAGLVLIFASTLYRFVRNLWVLLIYFFVRQTDQSMLLLIGLGTGVVLLLLLGYSILSFLKFKFHIDETNKEFVLEKGVFDSDVTNIPFGKIQQVNFKRSILQRVIGVYSLVIETAGSQEKEVEIKALSEEKANALADRLMDLKYREVGKTSEVTASEEISDEPLSSAPEWQYKISFMTLIKFGLTSNYLRGVGIIVAFYFTLTRAVYVRGYFPGKCTTGKFLAGVHYFYYFFTCPGDAHHHWRNAH